MLQKILTNSRNSLTAYIIILRVH